MPFLFPVLDFMPFSGIFYENGSTHCCEEPQKELFKEIECIWGDGVPMNFIYFPPPDINPPVLSSAIQVYDEKDELIVNKDNATSSMVAALLKMGHLVGLEKIANFTKDYKVYLDGLPLVKFGVHDAKNASSKEIEKGCYVNVHSNTDTKIRELERIAEAFNLGWRFEKV